MVLLLAEASAGALMLGASRRFDLRFLEAERHLRLAHLLLDPIHPGETIKLVSAAGITDRVALTAGWSVPEQTGVWTIGNNAEAMIALAPTGPDTRLQLRLDGLVAPGRNGHQEVSISVDGRSTDRIIPQGGPVTLEASVNPKSSASPSAHLVGVHLTIADPVSPSPADGRRLGFFLRSLAVIALRPGSPS